MLILRSCTEICQGTKRKQNRSEKKAQRFSSVPQSPLPPSPPPSVPWAGALPNGVNICANSIKWICSYACDLHFVGEITLSHACQGSAPYSHWVAAAAKHLLNRKGERGLVSLARKIFQVLLIFVFRINFYDFRAKLLCFLLFSCCFSFAIWKLARETMRKWGEGCGKQT